MWCHLLLLPLLGAALFLVLPWPVALVANAVLAAIAVGIGVLSVRALRSPVLTGPDALVGRTAHAVSAFEREGLVRYGGELWTAVASGRVREQAPVVIVGVEGTKLTVQPLESPERLDGIP